MKKLSTRRKAQIKVKYLNLIDKLINEDAWTDEVMTSIYHAYNNPSAAKNEAWQEIRKRQKEYNGTTPIILTHNCQAFTACFAYADEKGNVRYKYFTKDYTYDFE